MLFYNADLAITVQCETCQGTIISLGEQAKVGLPHCSAQQARYNQNHEDDLAWPVVGGDAESKYSREGMTTDDQVTGWTPRHIVDGQCGLRGRHIVDGQWTPRAAHCGGGTIDASFLLILLITLALL